jgi:hypothetical protein
VGFLLIEGVSFVLAEGGIEIATHQVVRIEELLTQAAADVPPSGLLHPWPQDRRSLFDPPQGIVRSV